MRSREREWASLIEGDPWVASAIPPDVRGNLAKLISLTYAEEQPNMESVNEFLTANAFNFPAGFTSRVAQLNNDPMVLLNLNMGESAFDVEVVAFKSVQNGQPYEEAVETLLQIGATLPVDYKTPQDWAQINNVPSDGSRRSNTMITERCWKTVCAPAPVTTPAPAPPMTSWAQLLSEDVELGPCLSSKDKFNLQRDIKQRYPSVNPTREFYESDVRNMVTAYLDGSPAPVQQTVSGTVDPLTRDAKQVDWRSELNNRVYDLKHIKGCMLAEQLSEYVLGEYGKYYNTAEYADKYEFTYKTLFDTTNGTQVLDQMCTRYIESYNASVLVEDRFAEYCDHEGLADARRSFKRSDLIQTGRTMARTQDVSDSYCLAIALEALENKAIDVDTPELNAKEAERANLFMNQAMGSGEPMSEAARPPRSLMERVIGIQTAPFRAKAAVQDSVDRARQQALGPYYDQYINERGLQGANQTIGDAYGTQYQQMQQSYYPGQQQAGVYGNPNNMYGNQNSMYGNQNGMYGNQNGRNQRNMRGNQRQQNGMYNQQNGMYNQQNGMYNQQNGMYNQQGGMPGAGSNKMKVVIVNAIGILITLLICAITKNIFWGLMTTGFFVATFGALAIPQQGDANKPILLMIGGYFIVVVAFVANVFI